MLMTKQAAADALYISDCDHNYDVYPDGIVRCIYCGQHEPVCPHERIDCYDEMSEEYVGWHCLDCGAEVDPPAAVGEIDELPC